MGFLSSASTGQINCKMLALGGTKISTGEEVNIVNTSGGEILINGEIIPSEPEDIEWTDIAYPAGAAQAVVPPPPAGGGITYQAPQYSRVDFGNTYMVMMRGVLYWSGGAAANTLIINMPEEYRPPATVYFNNGGDEITGAGGSNGIRVEVGGDVRVQAGGSYQGLDGIIYFVPKP